MKFSTRELVCGGPIVTRNPSFRPRHSPQRPAEARALHFQPMDLRGINPSRSSRFRAINISFTPC
jgi:hypothetical protein